MKIVFVSNFFNHHQEFLSNSLYDITKGEYTFIATEQVPAERIKLGYADANKKYEYILCTYESIENEEKAKKLIFEADVVIYEPTFAGRMAKRLKADKLTFMYSERIYKETFQWWKLPKWLYEHGKRFRRHDSLYLLCASAFASSDYAKTYCFINKAYKWSYFTEVKVHNIQEMIADKKKKSFLWAGRMIEWKHPEAPIMALKKLRDEGYEFQLNMIGTGEKEQEIQELIKKQGMEDCVKMLGSMSPQEVRRYMEESEIFLFTSDKQEGWGAVLNEAMNSGCAVIASHAIGSVPFLIHDKENGLIYKDGDIEDLCIKIKYLLDNEQKRKETGEKAYYTMMNEWNANNAAEKLVELSNIILNGERNPFPFKSGVCSKAEVLSDNWYK